MIDNVYPVIEASPWFVFVRVGTPANILTRLARAFRTAIQDRAIDAKVKGAGSRSKIGSPAETVKLLRRSTNNGARSEDGKDRGE